METADDTRDADPTRGADSTRDADPTRDGDERTESAADDVPTISAYSTSRERKVFTESDNGDGWIATDLSVEPER